MKKILLLMAVVMLSVVYGYSQAPGIFNYQGVARNSVGNVLVNKSITLRLTVHDGSAAGPVVYQESRAVTTNPFGLFNVQVGSAGATAVTGTVAGVNWGVGNKYIQVEIDPNGGTTFLNIGTAQMASVPYALYSNVSGDLVLPFNKTQADAGTLFKITNSGTGAGSTALEGLTNSTAGNVYAIIGTVTPTAPGGFSTGVRGVNNGTGGLGIGVWGSQNGSGWGVYGQTPGGIGVYGNTNTGFGLYGNATSGTGIYGISNTGRSGYFENTNAANSSSTLFSTSNGTGWAADFSSTNATTRALRTAGGLRFTGINEGLNRILASDATGNATWQNAAAIGVVTGSGTLNWVPKWTPNGTNLGNSIIEDRGINVVGVNVPAAYVYTNAQQGMEIHNAAALLQARVILRDVSDGGDVQGFVDARTSPTTTLSALQVGTLSNHPITFFGNGAHMGRWSSAGNLGIGTTAGVDPTARLQVDNALTTSGTVLVNQTGVGNLNRAMTVFNSNISSTAYANSSIYGQRGAGSLANTFLFTGIPTAVTGVSATAGIGVQGTSETQIGMAGLSTSGIGIYAASTGTATALRAEVFFGNPAAYALQTVGRVQISGQGAGLNKILTSDAVGNATWQTLGAGVGVGGSGTLNFVSKWTPDGFNLGNSQIFDNGNTVTVGGSFTANNSLSVLQTPANPVNPAIGMISVSQAAGIYLDDATGDVHFTANFNEVTTGAKIMTFEDINLNVGIGTATPAAESRLDVVGAGTTGSISTRTAVNANGSLDAINGHGVIANGEWRGVWGRNLSAGARNENSGVRGDAGGSNYNLGYGVIGTSTGSGANNFGLYGIASGSAGANIGVYANGSGLAAHLDGMTQAGSSTNNFSTINVGVTTGVTSPSISFTNGSNYFTQYENVSGQMVFVANNAAPALADIVMTLDDNNFNVGIGSTNPIARLHVDNPGTAQGGLLVDQGVEVGIPAAKVMSGGPITFDVSSIWGDNSVFAQRGNFSAGVILRNLGATAIMGVSPNAGNGVQGISESGAGVVGTTNTGTALLGMALSSGYGLQTQGKVQIQGQGAAIGYVLTSDATGNATWQDLITPNVGIGLQSLTGPVTLPSSTTVPITQWTTITHETGGANYNPLTGAYTITVAGVYQVNASLAFSAPASGAIDLIINSTSGTVSEATGYIEPNGFGFGLNANALRHFNVGDQISVSALQNTGVPLNMVAGFASNNFSVQLIRKD